jgi:hypothetical protein
MPPPNAKRRPGGGGAAVLAGNGNAAEHSPPARPAQLLDELGRRLPPRRSPVVGAPRLARSSWVRWSAGRWAEVRP